MSNGDDFVSLVAFGPQRTQEEVELLLERPITEFEVAKLQFHNCFCNVMSVVEPHLKHPALELEQILKPKRSWWKRLTRA
jgi:hypothetical protein